MTKSWQSGFLEALYKFIAGFYKKFLSSYMIAGISMGSPMPHTPHPSPSEATPSRSRGLFPRIFIQGPMLLLTSRISVKCAAMMMALCMPALLCWAVLTIPGLIFQSPQQHAYFYFSKILNEDPTRWLVLLLATVCALLALAVPAVQPSPSTGRNA